eukprot:gene21278-22104_t
MQIEVDDECAATAIAGGYANYPDFLEDDLIDDAPEDYEAEGGMMQTVETIAAQLPASITVKRGNEAVQAQRLSGITPMEITVRYDDTTATIGAGDNAVNDATGETYAIKWTGCLDEGRPRWLTISAESGTVANLPASVQAAAKAAIDASAKDTERRLYRATPLGPGTDHIRDTIEVVDGDAATMEKIVRIGDSALIYAIPLDFGHVTAGGTHVAGTKFFRVEGDLPMSRDPSLALQDAVYSAIKTLVSGKVFYRVPPKTPLPYIYIGSDDLQSDYEAGDFTE